jgi:hypothetical protein
MCALWLHVHTYIRLGRLLYSPSVQQGLDLNRGLLEVENPKGFRTSPYKAGPASLYFSQIQVAIL